MFAISCAYSTINTIVASGRWAILPRGIPNVSRIPLPILLPPLHSDPRAGINPPPPRRPLLTLSFRGSARNLGGNVPSITPVLGGRKPSLGGAAHPEQSRRVERGAPHCQTTPPPSFLRRQEPIPPEGAPPAEPGPLHPFLPRHSGRREPESITGGGQGGASCPLSLRWERARVGTDRADR